VHSLHVEPPHPVVHVQIFGASQVPWAHVGLQTGSILTKEEKINGKEIKKLKKIRSQFKPVYLSSGHVVNWIEVPN